MRRPCIDSASFDVWPHPRAQDRVSQSSPQAVLDSAIPRVMERLEQNQIVAWCDTGLAVVFSCLPPPTTDVANLQDLVL